MKNSFRSKKRICTFIIMIGAMLLSSCSLFSGCGDNNDIDKTETQETGAHLEAKEEISTTDSGTGDDSTDVHMTDLEKDKLVITISDDKYIYEDETLDFDELKRIIEDNPVSTIQIIDENAALKTYRELTDYLDKQNIEYTE